MLTKIPERFLPEGHVESVDRSELIEVSYIEGAEKRGRYLGANSYEYEPCRRVYVRFKGSGEQRHYTLASSSLRKEFHDWLCSEEESL